MNQQAKTFYELRFKTQFLESKATAFQDLFTTIMSKVHPGDFISCRPWGNVGDRKNDGYLKSERMLFQVYAPNEMKAADAVAKIEEDFSGALPYWRDYFDTWVFVHNAHGGLPPGVIAKLLEVEQSYGPIRIAHWGYEELLLRFQRLSVDALRSLYGSPPSGGDIRERRNQALSPMLKNKRGEAQAASRKRDIESALRLWEEVRQLAEKEGNKAEQLDARLQVILILIRDEGDLPEALNLAEACLQEVMSVDLAADRIQLLQLLGEIYRIKGDGDQARGFLMAALEGARSASSPLDEGFALLSLSALGYTKRGHADSVKALELIALAYNAFSAAYASGEEEQQRGAQDGFAQCHCWKAEIFGHSRPDDALAEWTRALTTYQQLGEDWELSAADTLLSRASLRARIKEVRLSAGDLDNAAQIFHRLNYTVGLAKCYLQAGELSDSIGERVKAAEHYKQAGSIASTWGNDRRASYYYFRYACKLMELREYEQAESILTWLVESEWLEREHRLTSMSLLCLIAQATNNEQKLKDRCASILSLIDEAIEESVSPENRRSLLLSKGSHFVQLGMHEEALALFRQAALRFESANDRTGLVECWFQIRGLMQQLGDLRGEREASDKVLALGAEELSPMFAALTLVGLAQLNIKEQRYGEARAQLDRAKELDPDNPVVSMIDHSLRSDLPQFYPRSVHADPAELQRPTERDLKALIRDLHEWCACYPDKRKSVLAVWYYIHRIDLWNLFRSALGVKFLVCTEHVGNFEHIKNKLSEHGELFVWGTNFPLHTKAKKSRATIDLVPVPDWYRFPAGTKVVFREGPQGEALGRVEKRRKSSLLRPATIEHELYFLAPVEKSDDPRGFAPCFVGQKQVWRDLKVVKFMLDPIRVCDDSICLPVGERGVMPNLKRSLQVASENTSIPIFLGNLPQYHEVSSVCDSVLELPTGAVPLAAKQLWDELLSSCSSKPRSSLISFIRGMQELSCTATHERLPVRVYLLRFLADTGELVYPAIVVMENALERKRAPKPS